MAFSSLKFYESALVSRNRRASASEKNTNQTVRGQGAPGVDGEVPHGGLCALSRNSRTVRQAILAARSRGNPYTPVEMAGNATDSRPSRAARASDSR